MFEQIDHHLHNRDAKKAEVLIAKQLRDSTLADIRAELLVRRAKARLIGQRPDEALEDIQTAFALDPELAQVVSLKELQADIYFARFELSPVGFAERSNADTALIIYQSIIDDTPEYQNLGWIHYQMARVLLTANQTERAIKGLQQALLAPSLQPALTAFCYERLGFIHLYNMRDPKAALGFMEKAAVTYPVDEPESWLAQLHILRSKAMREAKDYDSALDAAEKALRIMESLGPDMRDGQQDAHFALGEILANIPGKEMVAAGHLQQFMQLGKKPPGVDVTWSRVNELLGEMLFRLERYDASIEAYEYALTYNPYHPWQTSLYFQIARSYYRLRIYEKTIDTIAAMEESVSTEAQTIKDYRVFQLLGNAYFALEDYRDAALAYQQAITLAPEKSTDYKKISTYLRFAEELIANT